MIVDKNRKTKSLQPPKPFVLVCLLVCEFLPFNVCSPSVSSSLSNNVQAVVGPFGEQETLFVFKVEESKCALRLSV